MTEYVYAADTANPDLHNAICQWVSEQSFGVSDNVWADSYSLGFFKNNRIIAGVVYHDHKPATGTIQYSGASDDPSWLEGSGLHHMFNFMFEHLDCQSCFTGNAASNTRLHRLLEITDHHKHVIERGWGRGEDMFFWTLTKERWQSNKLFKRSAKWAAQQQECADV